LIAINDRRARPASPDNHRAPNRSTVQRGQTPSVAT
jgi:hypothetical protein